MAEWMVFPAQTSLLDCNLRCQGHCCTHLKPPKNTAGLPKQPLSSLRKVTGHFLEDSLFLIPSLTPPHDWGLGDRRTSSRLSQRSPCRPPCSSSTLQTAVANICYAARALWGGGTLCSRRVDGWVLSTRETSGHQESLPPGHLRGSTRAKGFESISTLMSQVTVANRINFFEPYFLFGKIK